MLGRNNIINAKKTAKIIILILDELSAHEREREREREREKERERGGREIIKVA
jgi:hypothetical protein